MAELSDADKRVLLGANYLEIEREAAARNNQTSSSQAAADKLKKGLQLRNSSGAIALIAALVFVTNYLQMSGPYQPYMSITAAVGAIGAAVIAVYAQMRLQS